MSLNKLASKNKNVSQKAVINSVLPPHLYTVTFKKIYHLRRHDSVLFSILYDILSYAAAFTNVVTQSGKGGFFHCPIIIAF